MTKDELIAELAKNAELVPTDPPGTFLKRNETFKNLHAFFRPIADDRLLMVWMLNYSNAEARSTGLQILDRAEAAQDQIAGRLTTKLGGLDSGFPQFDHLIALGPGYTTS